MDGGSTARRRNARQGHREGSVSVVLDVRRGTGVGIRTIPYSDAPVIAVGDVLVAGDHLGDVPRGLAVESGHVLRWCQRLPDAPVCIAGLDLHGVGAHGVLLVAGDLCHGLAIAGENDLGALLSSGDEVAERSVLEWLEAADVATVPAADSVSRSRD